MLEETVNINMVAHLSAKLKQAQNTKDFDVCGVKESHIG
jgi:hypothetical protein